MNKKQLPKRKQWLVRQCQLINFGRIALYVVRGEPDLSRPWHTRRSVKLAGGENGPRREGDIADFELRKEHVALFDQLSSLTDGQCVRIEVKHGLPFLIEIEQDHEAA